MFIGSLAKILREVKMKTSQVNQSINEINQEFIKARNSIGIVNQSHLSKFLVSGTSSLI